LSFQRPTGAVPGLGAEPAPPTGQDHPAGAASDGASPALRLQILSTEHWSLLASRSLAWNESFSRAGMSLATISGAIVALALVAQASDFGRGFRLFALAILPVVLFVGVGTVLRIGEANYHDSVCVAGMNRIRAGYLEFAPDLQRFFVMGTHDDRPGMLVTMGIAPNRSFVVHMLAATPMLIGTLNSILLAAIVSLLALQLGATSVVAVVLGGLAFVATLVGHILYARHAIEGSFGRYEPVFPTPSLPADR